MTGAEGVPDSGAHSRETETKSGFRARFGLRSTSVATRLALSVLVVSITSLAITAAVGFSGAQNSADNMLQRRLPVLRSAKAAEIERFFANSEAQVAGMAQSRMFIDGVQRFAEAHRALNNSLDADELADAEARVSAFYLEGFIPDLESVRGEGVPPLDFAVGSDLAGTYLQDLYIAANPLEVGEKELLTDARDGSAWSGVHAELHPRFRDIVNRFGFADLFLIDPESNTIVYSNLKEVDFATSLTDGPQSTSSLAHLVNEARAAGPGDVLVSDFETYPPSLDAPSAFMASPLFDGDELVGVVAVQLDKEDINQIMASNWRNDEVGETGEIYLVGPDGRMRSDSRLFIEDPLAFFDRIDEMGELEGPERAQILAQGTTMLFLPVNNDAVGAAYDIDEGVVETESYLGRDVLTAYQPVGVPGLDWVLLAEQERAEVNGPIDDFRNESLMIAAIFVTALSFLAVIWANAFVAPVRAISTALLEARDGTPTQPGDTSGGAAVPVEGAREFQEMGHDFNRMVADLAVREEAVRKAVHEKRALLMRLLPASAARAVDQGDRTLLEAIPQVTVGVLVLTGLEDVVRADSASHNRRLLHALVDEIDALADMRGVERVKIVADTYYAACGLAGAYLDHAPRTVAFAVAAREAVGRFRREHSQPLDLAAGIHTGSVTVGLTGASRLVYDIWGDALQTAHELSRLANPGQILASTASHDRLPPDLLRGAHEAYFDDATAWSIGGDPVSAGTGMDPT